MFFIFSGLLPQQYFADPGHIFSLYPVSPVPPGPHMFWVPDPSAHPPLDLVLALNVLLESDHSSAFLAPSLNPSLHRFCPPPPRIPAAEPGPVPTGLPQSPCLRSLGYSEAQRQGWSGCPESSDCPWRRRKTRWSCS